MTICKVTYEYKGKIYYLIFDDDDFDFPLSCLSNLQIMEFCIQRSRQFYNSNPFITFKAVEIV